MDDFEYYKRISIVIEHSQYKNFFKITENNLKSIDLGIKIIRKFYYKKDMLNLSYNKIKKVI